MMPYGLLLGFVVLYISAKLTERNVPFYLAALFFVVVYKIFEIVLLGEAFILNTTLMNSLIKFIVALPIFYFFNEYEDTIAAWLVTFVIGFVLLVVIL